MAGMQHCGNLLIVLAGGGEQGNAGAVDDFLRRAGRLHEPFKFVCLFGRQAQGGVWGEPCRSLAQK
jgi:hypothetical protein